jgi:hypothetical protein
VSLENIAYASPDIISVTKSRWVGHVAHTDNKTLFGNHEGKRPLERPGRRWEDNI